MIQLATPAFVFFDLGNVLIHFDHQLAVAELAKLCSASENEVRELVFQGPLQSDYERGAIATAEFCEQIRTKLNCSATDPQICHAASDIFWINTSIVPLLASLRRGNVPIGILSNTCEAHWAYLIARYRILVELFQVRVLSFEAKSSKPERSIFSQAADAAGCAIENLFFTDDINDNVQGAVEAGIDAVQFQSANQLEWQLRRRGLRF